MKQVELHDSSSGAPLRVGTGGAPAPSNGQVAIRVAYAGVGYSEYLATLGQLTDTPRRPFVPGFDLVGRVEAGGSLSPGTPVIAFTRFGAWRERVIVSEDVLRPVPEGLRLRDAAAYALPATLAELALVQLGGLQRGESVLIHSVGGAVGLQCLQLARHLGARVLGTCGYRKRATLAKRGVELSADVQREDFERAITAYMPDGVDLIVDSLGDEALGRNLRLLAEGGRLVCLGQRESTGLGAKLRGGASRLRVDAGALSRYNKRLLGLGYTRLFGLPETRPKVLSALDRALERLAAGNFEAYLDRIYPFAQAADAIARSAARENLGRTLLEFGGEADGT